MLRHALVRIIRARVSYPSAGIGTVSDDTVRMRPMNRFQSCTITFICGTNNAMLRRATAAMHNTRRPHPRGVPPRHRSRDIGRYHGNVSAHRSTVARIDTGSHHWGARSARKSHMGTATTTGPARTAQNRNHRPALNRRETALDPPSRGGIRMNSISTPPASTSGTARPAKYP